MSLSLRPSLTAGELEEAVNHAQDERPFLVDGLLYEKAALLVSGDPGSGKSVVQLSAFAQCTAGLPVFGQLPCIRPLNCYCLFSERINQEALERLRLIRLRVPIDFKRLHLDDGFVGIADVTKAGFANEIVANIKNAKYADGKTDVVGLDSLYGFIPGGLSKDEKASEFARFVARLQSELGVSLWLVHHTTKATYASQTGEKVEKDDPFYGSQWLRAMVTGSYYLRRNGDGVLLSKKKDTFGALLSQLPLDYDPETHVVSLPESMGVANAADRGVLWLHKHLKMTPEKEFTFDDFCRGIDVSHAHGRRLMIHKEITPHITRVKSVGPKIFYRAC